MVHKYRGYPPTFPKVTLKYIQQCMNALPGRHTDVHEHTDVGDNCTRNVIIMSAMEEKPFHDVATSKMKIYVCWAEVVGMTVYFLALWIIGYSAGVLLLLLLLLQLLGQHQFLCCAAIRASASRGC